MSNKQKIGIAIIGTGFGEKIHIPGCQHHHRTEVVAVYNPDLSKAKAIASKYNIPYGDNDLNRILSLPEVDAVTISTPPFLHYEMAKATLEAGKHLLLEKPITMNVEEAKELYHLAQQKNLIVTPDFEFRCVPSWQLLKEYLDNDYVGKIRLIKIDWLVVSRANPDRPWNWYSQKSQGGGVLGAVGSHSFDYIHWLFGQIKKLNGYLSCAIAQRPDPKAGGELKPVTADDTCVITLELRDGTPCQLNISSVTYQGRGHWLEIYGEKGTLILGSDNLKDYVHGFKLFAATKDTSLKEVEIPQRLAFPKVFPDGRLAPFMRVLDRFIESIDTGKTLKPSLIEGIYSQLLMDLTYQSHQSQSWVDVPLLEEFLNS